jgi:hypothetical protein
MDQMETAGKPGQQKPIDVRNEVHEVRFVSTRVRRFGSTERNTTDKIVMTMPTPRKEPLMVGQLLCIA